MKLTLRLITLAIAIIVTALTVSVVWRLVEVGIHGVMDAVRILLVGGLITLLVALGMFTYHTAKEIE